jgi:hypothetical protein
MRATVPPLSPLYSGGRGENLEMRNDLMIGILQHLDTVAVLESSRDILLIARWAR